MRRCAEGQVEESHLTILKSPVPHSKRSRSLPVRHHLYFIQSPLQAINAHEARRTIADGVESHTLIAFERREARNNVMLGNTLRALGWEAFRTVPFRAGSVGKTLEWLRLRVALRGFVGVERVYVGDFAAGMALSAANLFPHAEFYLLDDGTSTITFPAFRYEGRPPEHRPPARSLPWLGYNPVLPRAITYFSIYDVPVQTPDRLRRNQLESLREQLTFDENGPVFFIGSCLPDVEVITFPQFEQLLRAARNWLGRREIVYFAHRRELIYRKKELFSDLDIKVVHADLPLELELRYREEKPSLIATFYSTALDTLSLALRGRNGHLVAFEVPEEWVRTEDHRDIAKQSYLQYRASKEIQVISNY